jgi:hypothetical protein
VSPCVSLCVGAERGRCGSERSRVAVGRSGAGSPWVAVSHLLVVVASAQVSSTASIFKFTRA